MARFHYRQSPSEKQRKAFAKYLSEDEELVLVTSFSQDPLQAYLVLHKT